MTLSMTRREFIRNTAVAVAANVAGLALPASATNVLLEGDMVQLKWSKAPCRFCGTGCGVNVAVKDGRVVATHGDQLSEVNRGINCVKGYFLSKIMYGADRLTAPMLRKKNGVYAKDGTFTEVSWDEAFDVMAQQFKRVLKEKGPEAVDKFFWKNSVAACSAPANGRYGKATPPTSCSRAASAATRSIPTRATAWPPP